MHGYFTDNLGRKSSYHGQSCRRCTGRGQTRDSTTTQKRVANTPGSTLTLGRDSKTWRRRPGYVCNIALGLGHLVWTRRISSMDCCGPQSKAGWPHLTHWGCTVFSPDDLPHFRPTVMRCCIDWELLMMAVVWRCTSGDEGKAAEPCACTKDKWLHGCFQVPCALFTYVFGTRHHGY